MPNNDKESKDELKSKELLQRNIREEVYVMPKKYQLMRKRSDFAWTIVRKKRIIKVEEREDRVRITLWDLYLEIKDDIFFDIRYDEIIESDWSNLFRTHDEIIAFWKWLEKS